MRTWMLVAAVLVAGFPSTASAEVAVTTHVYKTVGNLDIKLDLLRESDNKVRPLVVWIHGGALMMGGRQAVNRRFREKLLAGGYAIASLDYRLAPETKLPHIIKDLEDAFAWLRSNGKELNVDASRIAVAGGSAGGYLTLTSGIRVKPRPTVLVSFWGYGEVVGDWYSRPSKHKRYQDGLSAKQARKTVGKAVIANGIDRDGADGMFAAGPYYHMCRRRGTWPQAVSNWHPKRDAKKFRPYMPLFHVTPDYPPTILVHGSKDTDVPVQQSLMMADAFAEHGVKHDLVVVGGGEHGLGGGAPDRVEAAFVRAFEFLDAHMKAPAATP